MHQELSQIHHTMQEMTDALKRGMTKEEVAFEMVKLINGGRNYPSFEERKEKLMELYKEVYMLMTEVEKL